MYLERFYLPTEEMEKELLAERASHNGGLYGYIDNPYPCGIFPQKALRELRFGRITVFYGGNGSGKSTLLNLIAQKLALNRIAPFNSGELFAACTDACSYEMGFDDEGFRHRVPNGSRIITSDDVFDYMLTVRANNSEIAEEKERAREAYRELKYGETVQMHSLDDYEALRAQVLARKKTVSRRQFIRKAVGAETALRSNGETALSYFEAKLKENTLYLLDEPENSMSPKMQLSLAKMLEEAARFFGNQLILATHSPFLLAMKGAEIYNLDAVPAERCPWWALENTRIYYSFFKEHENLFRQTPV